MEQRTIKYWFNRLPEPFRSKALYNSSSQNSLDEPSYCLKYSILEGFIWDKTEEGFTYWKKVYDCIKNTNLITV
jgi:hypothetical protein